MDEGRKILDRAWLKCWRSADTCSTVTLFHFSARALLASANVVSYLQRTSCDATLNYIPYQ